MRVGTIRRRVGVGAVLLGAVVGCDDDPVFPEEGVVFTVEVSGEEFRALVTDPEVAADLTARLQAGVEGVLSGELVAGDGGFNAPWSWHWDPQSVHAAELAIEVCDGRPSMVEEDLSYWLGTVERFCPWGARVVAREP